MKYALGNMLNGAGGLNADQLALDLQFAADKTLTARKGPTPVLTRGSTGTFVGSNGLIQTAASGAARFDHDPVTLASRGLLIEEGRTNQFVQSDNFASVSWPIVNATLSSNVETAPDGSTTADKLIVNSGTTIGRVSQAFTLTGTYTMSVFAKAGEWGWVFISPLGPSGGVWFNLSSGVVGTQNSGFVGSITSFGNGWYRCSVVFTGLGTSLTSRIVSTNADGVTSTGNGTSGIFIWGAQLEAGAFPTSYIPTTTSALARSADVCSITGASSTFGNTDGTLFTIGGSLFISTTTNNNICSIDSGTTGQLRIFTRAAQAGRLSAMVSNVILTPSSGYNTAGVFYKAAIAANSSGADYVIDGTQIPDTYTGSSITADNLKITGVSGATTNSWISSIRYYKKRLPVSKLQALTA